MKIESRCAIYFMFFALLGHDISAVANKGKAEVPLKPTKVYHDEEASVFVYDNVLGKRLLSASSELVRRFATWFFVHPDAHEGVENRNNGGLDWIAPFSPKQFSKSKIWHGLRRGLKRTGIFDGRKLYPYDVEGVMLLRGLSPSLYKGKGEGDIFIRVFLNRKFKKNDYSELQLYNNKEEIIASVFPKYGRVVVWNDTADFIFKPPSFNVEQAEYSLLIKVTEDQNKFQKHEEEFQKSKEEYKKQTEVEFPLTNKTYDDIYKINLAKHLTYNFTDSMGRVVAVFDDVVPKEELDVLRSYFMKSNSAYIYDSYDNNFEESNDNVAWIVKKKAGAILKSRVWKYVHHCVSFLSSENQWYPYDVAMNIIQHSHHTRIHADCSQHEHEYTFLMYLSPEWHDGKYGETVFVEQASEQKMKSSKPGNEKYETLSAVTPKYGRIVAFRNIIEHSARPPSPDFLAARYTFAVKVGRSPEIALAKALRETIEMITESEATTKLAEELNKGKYDINNDSKTEMFLQENLELYQEKAMKERVGVKRRLLELLELSGGLP